MRERHTPAREASKIDFHSAPNTEGWVLCNDAEDYFLESAHDRALMVIRDILVVKHTGKMAGICVEDTEHFRRGWWYIPSEPIVRKDIRRAFDRGIRRTDDVYGTWMEVRPVKAHLDSKPEFDCVVRADEHAEDTSEKLPLFYLYGGRMLYRKLKRLNLLFPY